MTATFIAVSWLLQILRKQNHSFRPAPQTTEYARDFVSVPSLELGPCQSPDGIDELIVDRVLPFSWYVL